MKKQGIIGNISTGKTTYCLQQKKLFEGEGKTVCVCSIDEMRRNILYNSHDTIDQHIRDELCNKGLVGIILFNDESKMNQFINIIVDRLIELCNQQIASGNYDLVLIEMGGLFHPKLYDLVDHNFVILNAHPSELDQRNAGADLGDELLIRERYLSYRIGKFLCEAIEMRREVNEAK